MNEITAMSLPEQDSTHSLQDRLRDLRSRVQPEKGLDEAKLKKACQDFEAVFIGQIWKQMRSSVPKEGLLHSKEEESYLSMFDQELSVGIGQPDAVSAANPLEVIQQLLRYHAFAVIANDDGRSAGDHRLDCPDQPRAERGPQSVARFAINPHHLLLVGHDARLNACGARRVGD